MTVKVFESIGFYIRAPLKTLIKKESTKEMKK